MKILIVTDAWDQTNGVVTTLNNLIKELEKSEHTVKVLSHKNCQKTRPMPFYPEVTLAYVSQHVLEENIFWADAVHISTPEGPVGFRAMRFCNRNKIPYTTGYHTKWPEFIKARFSVILTCLTYPLFRWLHRHSEAVLVPTRTVQIELKNRGFRNVKVWTRGVNRNNFSPSFRDKLSQIGHPFMVCVSRVSREKGLDDFCKMKWSGRHTKVIVGDGPYRIELQEKYPDVIFAGEKRGMELAQFYASADVFVFPSKADTFGLVMIESMASGTPVAAYPVTGPVDVITQGVTGYMHEDLSIAVQHALMLDRDKVEQYSKKWCWKACAEEFLNFLVARH